MRQNGKGPMDDIHGCIKNAIYRAAIAEKNYTYTTRFY